MASEAKEETIEYVIQSDGAIVRCLERDFVETGEKVGTIKPSLAAELHQWLRGHISAAEQRAGEAERQLATERASHANMAADYAKILAGTHERYWMLEKGDVLLRFVRHGFPRDGEVYQYGDALIKSSGDHSGIGNPLPIYRRIDAPADAAPVGDMSLLGTISDINQLTGKMKSFIGGYRITQLGDEWLVWEPTTDAQNFHRLIGKLAYLQAAEILARWLPAPADATSGETTCNYSETPACEPAPAPPAEEGERKLPEWPPFASSLFLVMFTGEVPSTRLVHGFEQMKSYIAEQIGTTDFNTDFDDIDSWQHTDHYVGNDDTRLRWHDEVDEGVYLTITRVMEVDPSPSHARIRELEQEVERLKADIGEWNRPEIALIYSAPETAGKFVIRWASSAIDRLDADDKAKLAEWADRLRERIYEMTTPAQPAKPETGKGDDVCEFGYVATLETLHAFLGKVIAARTSGELCGVFKADGDCLRVDDFQWCDSEGELVSPLVATEVTIGTFELYEEPGERDTRITTANEFKAKPDPSPHVETGGQEPTWEAREIYEAINSARDFRKEWLPYSTRPLTKEQAEAAARDIAAMAAVRDAIREFQTSTNDESRYFVFAGNVIRASQLSASQADQQDGKERA